MSNPTSNFNWQMPTNTDLVSQLPADFEVFGQAVDTSLADLKGGTTGQILSKNSNTDMDFVWTSANPGDITGITASSPLTGGGTSGDVTIGILNGTTSNLGAVQLSDSTSSTSTTLAATANAVKTTYDLANGAIPKTLIDAAGDLIVGTAADTAGRLGIGSASQILAVNSGATALEWVTPSAGGGMTLIGTSSLSGASVTISSIPSTYKHLMILIERAYSSSSDYPMALRFNSDTGSNYNNKTLYGQTDANSYAYFRNDSVNATSMEIRTRTLSSVDAGKNLNLVLNIYNYSSTSPRYLEGSAYSMNSGSEVITTQTTGTYKGSSAISSVTALIPGTNWSGGTFSVYGVS